MSLPLELGTIAPLRSILNDLIDRVHRRSLRYPECFSSDLQLLVTHHYDSNALVLPAGTTIEGDLALDWSTESRRQELVAVIALGDLTLSGISETVDLNDGLLLFVDGTLNCRRMEKGGSRIYVLGDLRARGVVLCDYSDGELMVGGDLVSEALIAIDQGVGVSGSIHGPRVLWGEMSTPGEKSPREFLVPDVFGAPDDPTDDFPDGDIIRERLAMGLPVLKT
jgi:hypothetical protein